MMLDVYRGSEMSPESSYCGEKVNVLAIRHSQTFGYSTTKQDLYLCSFYHADTALERQTLSVQVDVRCKTAKI